MKSLIIYSDFDGCPSIFNKNATMEELVTPQYYRNTRPDMTYITMIKELINAGYEVRFLSKVLSPEITKAKIEFLKEYGIEVPFIPVPYDKDKAAYIDQNKINVLIDDFTPGLKDWEKYGENFIGIKYYNGVNGTKGTWDGYSINNRMTAKKMAFTVMALADLVEEDLAA